ncbi:MAG: ABC transporter ATP-binding protein [Pseudomonadota bacterium]|nr:ABC transporter ATP-binding protein [Pseudomonadota bacterium]
MRSVSLSDVMCKIQGKNAVNGISLNIKPGEIICFLGPSGCGKTTSLRLIGGIVKPNNGEISIDDEIVSSASFQVPPEDRHIGFLFQDFALFPHLSVMQNVLFGLSIQKHEDADARAGRLLALTGVSHLAERYPDTLSGGEQQRVALARAIAPAPGLVLMDEPFSNLDPPLRADMRRLTVSLLRGEHTDISPATGIIVTHDAVDAMHMADKIAVMSEGQIVQFDKPDQIYENPASPLVVKLMGASNEWTGAVNNGVFSTPIGDLQLDTSVASARLMIRPYHLKAGGGENSFIARLSSLRNHGNTQALDVLLSDGTIWEVVGNDFIGNGLQIGDEVKFQINPEDVMLFTD